jgi:ketosteroid isomerase-like protein
MSEENVKVINKIYEAFNQGNFPAVLDLFDPTIEWIAAENSPLADRSPYHGLDEIREGVFMRIAAGFEGLTVKVDELLDAGDKVVVLGFYDGIRKATGKRIHAQVAHIWTIAAGKVTTFQQYTDTYQLAESGKSSTSDAARG